MQQPAAYSALIQRLDQFIRKYYLNQVIRGSLYTLGAVGLAFLAVSLLEANFFFDKSGRKALFYGFIAFSLICAGVWVILPATHYFRLGSVISHDRAAAIIGDHFGNVKDKLLNLLQLGREAQLSDTALTSSTSTELLLASISQKSEELQPVPFRRAIDLGENRKYLRYALPPLLLLIVLLVAAPTLITDSTSRLVRNNEDFERPAPFHFVLPKGDLQVVQFEDYPLTVKVEGTVVPAEAYITIDGNAYRMSAQGAGTFTYKFQSVAKDLNFKLTSGDVSSRPYELDVIEKPNLLGFSVRLDYPAYTGRRDETVDNLGDLTVPVGTRMRWTFDADNTDAIELRFGQQLDSAKREGRQLFLHDARALRSLPYTIISGNDALPRADSVRYGITVIPDRYPTIAAQTFRDSSQRNVVFFAGEATDDYGLSALRFVYTRTNEQGATLEEQVDLGTPSGKTAAFDYTFDIASLSLKPGEEISYYFETLDNDGVNGAKSARTPVESFRKKTLDEYEESREEQSDDIKRKLRESIQESKEIQEEMKRLRENLLQEKELDWQAKRELEKLLERQQALEEKIEEAKEEFQEQLEEQEEFQEQPDPELEEKQERLEEMFEELEDPEMKELMEKIQELMEKLEKDEALDMMEQMESNDEQQEQKLDRLEELFKKLEVEYEMQEAAEKLEELAEKQEELAEETQEKQDGQQNDEQQAKQEELNKEFEKLAEQMEELDKKNEELERPMDTGTDQQKQEEVKQDQQEAGEQMDQQQNQQAGKKQKQAAQKMKEMAQQMKQAGAAGQQQQAQEDIKSLRQLLENLVSISFDQEDLLEAFSVTEENTPRYVEEVQRQFKLKDDFRIVEDSLQALAKRVIQIESFVLEKVGDIKVQLDKGLKNLEERQVGQAANRQQRVMTDVNDLALMLSESMEQMQQQMAQSMPGSQSCEKPGGKGKGKPGQQSGSEPSDQMSEGQQSLKEQMERAMENMKKQAEGRKAGKGEGGPSSREFAEMAQRQAELRKKLRDKQRKLQEQGKGSQELQGIIDEMNKAEEDLVNKRLTNRMLERQQDILTRLLEAEKAERQQDEDQKRKSETAQEIERTLPPALEEYLRQRAAQTDIYREVSPELKPYYRQLVERYFEELRSK